MAISIDDDLATCFSTDDFAEAAVFTTSGGTVTVNGYFTGPTDETSVFGVAIEAAKPTFQCRTSEITAVKIKNSVVINGVTYTVERIEKVGTGVSVVYLKT